MGKKTSREETPVPIASAPSVAEAFRQIRDSGDFEEWHWTETDRYGIRAGWLSDPEGCDIAALERKWISPWSADLEAAQSALPKDRQIHHVEMDPILHRMYLHLKPIGESTGRPNRCSQCNDDTEVYGVKALCAVCSTRTFVPFEQTEEPQTLQTEQFQSRNRRESRLATPQGSALTIVLLAISALGILIASAAVTGIWSDRLLDYTEATTQADYQAQSTLALMTSRLAARTQFTLGNLTQADLDTLNLEIPSFADSSIDLSRTGYRLTGTTDYEQIPDDADVLYQWSHLPRPTFATMPPAGGMVASRTLEITLYATAHDERGVERTASHTFGISRIPPHQYGLYVDGDTDFCASQGMRNTFGGPLRVDGHANFLPCPYLIRYTGSLEIRDGLETTEPKAHYLLGADGAAPLPTLTAAQARSTPSSALGPWMGRIRIAPTTGGPSLLSLLQNDQIAGSGECPDVQAGTTLGCGTTDAFLPSFQIQHMSRGPDTTFTARCGTALDGNPSLCATISTAFRYLPWPFSSAPPAGTAAFDPNRPTQIWQGFFPDGRREARCTASQGSISYRTHRCPTNAYGFLLDMRLLPAIPGGLISILGAQNAAPGANPDGQQEVLVITHAQNLAGPLTIHSNIPVYIEGDYNTLNSRPALIQAPSITVLPRESGVGIPPTGQLATSSVWDSVPAYGEVQASSLLLTAETNVSLFAVLRTRACSRTGGHYYGGPWESVPTLLGDWRNGGIKIAGALEVQDVSQRDPARCTNPLDRPLPSGGTRLRAASRTVVFDSRLLHPSFQPPGSWSPENIPLTGLPSNPARTPTRQSNAIGGTTVLRSLGPVQTGPPRVPAARTFPPLPPLPAAPAPLP